MTSTKTTFESIFPSDRFFDNGILYVKMDDDYAVNVLNGSTKQFEKSDVVRLVSRFEKVYITKR